MYSFSTLHEIHSRIHVGFLDQLVAYPLVVFIDIAPRHRVTLFGTVCALPFPLASFRRFTVAGTLQGFCRFRAARRALANNSRSSLLEQLLDKILKTIFQL